VETEGYLFTCDVTIYDLLSFCFSVATLSSMEFVLTLFLESLQIIGMRIQVNV